MNTGKLLSTLGLCRKAGRLIMGYDAVANAAARGEICLVLLAHDLSEKSAQNIERVMQRHRIALCAVPVSMDDIADRVGRRTGILGVADRNLARAVQNALDSLT